MRDKRHTMAEGACCYPSVIWINRVAISFPFRDKPPITSGDFMVVGDNHEISQSCFKLPASFFAPVGFLRAIIQFADRNERNGEQMSLEMRRISDGHRPALKQIGNDAGVYNDLGMTHAEPP